ncbi:uncharacterized protein LOC143276534 [Babylonia areolata]|uniref:uncharacterized protein LOC143276534 n=1 Tax=Babylonia areolata TaxID=304850 RepID=UPI003FD0AEE2
MSGLHRLWVLAALLLLGLPTAPASTTDSEETNDYGDDDFSEGSCSNQRLKCAKHSLCVQNRMHTRFKCYCPEGYEGDGYLSTYRQNATGCSLVGNPITCKSAGDCHQYASCVMVADTALFVCDCNAGFVGNGDPIDPFGCTDVKECDQDPCALNANCTESPGSYHCHCDSSNNYEGDGFDSCSWVCYNHRNCDVHARCEDGKCQCDPGYLGDGRLCTDVDECQNGNATCPEKSSCLNVPGSYQCICANGYELQNGQCVPYHKTCDDLFKTWKGMVSGQYTLDFDGEGPLPAVEVTCVLKANFAITEVTPTPTFPLPIPSQGDEVPVLYPTDTTPLVDNSRFCSQEVWMRCSSDYDGGPIQWEDARGTRHTGWGGTTTSKKCACGEVGQCPKGCNCGHGDGGEDGGVIIRKEALPLSRVILPPSSRGGSPGTYYVGRLRCGPQSFDVPRNCQEAKFQLGLKQNTPLLIDIDGPGPLEPVLVFCNQEAFSHVGIIEIPPDRLRIGKTGRRGRVLTYTLPAHNVTALIHGSLFCSQRVQYRCQSDTLTKARVQVTTRSGLMTYFPGGSNDKPGSCPCGLTNSCSKPKVNCNCDVEEGGMRRDFGLIVDKSQLPVLSVRSTSGANYAFTLGPLQCSDKQFGIEPNCEKYRQDGITRNYTYLIDPDGPKGPVVPFLVECEMDANQGVTVVNNDFSHNVYFDVEEGRTVTITYPQTTPIQLAMLKVRSTVCVQNVVFDCGLGNHINIGGFVYNRRRPLTEQLANVCPSAVCPCNVPLTVSKMGHLPIVAIKGPQARMTIGALKCKEIFPDCETYSLFLRKRGVEGEKMIAWDTLTIDPDGAGDGPSFVAQCNKKETIIDEPTMEDPPLVRLKPDKPNPGELCWKLNYTDVKGAVISPPQMDALMQTAKNCAQTVRLKCSNALGTGMVRYKDCGGQEFSSFVSSEVDATCACGASGTCVGGPDEGCNCDSSGDSETMDVNWIIANDRLPVCEVCLKLPDTPGGGSGVPETRLIKFDVSELRCGKKQGLKRNCQLHRQESRFQEEREETQRDIWMNTIHKPIIVGCRFKPNPPVGEMIIRPEVPVYEPGDPNYQKGRVNVIYRGFPIIAFRQVTRSSTYCTQHILFFCAEKIPRLSGRFGLFSRKNRLRSSDYEIRDLTSEGADAVCGDERFSEVCARCGRPRQHVVVTNKARLPVTSLRLHWKSSAHVAVDDVACSYVEKDCEAIARAHKEKRYVLDDGYFLVDPDQTGPLPPFKVLCNFHSAGGAVTVVPSNAKWATGHVGGRGGEDGADFSFTHTYPTASPEQIHSLVTSSHFCWQGVKYECQEAPLTNSALIGFNNQSLTSFGTADDSAVMGCACGVLGTCVSEGVTCNCDSKGSMVDQGFITDKHVLPVIGFDAHYGPGGKGTLTVTDVRCAPTPSDIPRDCNEAYSWRRRHGVDYSRSGEILINPSPHTLPPFLVYCDFSTYPGNPVMVMKPTEPDTVPVGQEDPQVRYQGLSQEEVLAVVNVSLHCHQPVRVDCISASFITAGVRFRTADGETRALWSSGIGDTPTCTCGTQHLCGGDRSLSAQKLTNCNCDIGDDVKRSDAAILDVTKGGPLWTLLTKDVLHPSRGQLNLTVGHVFCAPKPIEFDECETGFHDCAESAECRERDQGYTCQCPRGWTGKVATTSNTDRPMANGRQCIDDNECTLSNQCRYNSDCENTLGSYRCVCKPGYRQVDDFTCVDVNECEEEMDDCDVKARCINTDGSYRCRCHKGYRGTGHAGSCHAVGLCSCFGDPHCESFDGRWSHYQGLCAYVMATTDCGSNFTDVSGKGPLLPNFRVSTWNWDHGYVGSGQYSWVKEVVVEVYGKTIVLGQGKSISVDGQSRKIYLKMNDDRSAVRLSVSAEKDHVVVYTDFGLEVVWNGDHEVTVYAPTTFQHRTCGLCGNFNGFPQDDWTVGPACPDTAGQITTLEPLFGTSWTLNLDTCPVNCDPEEPESTCDAPMDLVKEECSKLFAVIAFAECLKEMPPVDHEGFRVSCVYDLCHSANPGATLCDVGMVLAHYCEELMADVIEWKTDEMCGDTSCKFVSCNEPNTICADGECVCRMGFTADCEQCIDVDECAVGEHNCTYLGQACNNTEGSFQCTCLPGFEKHGELCNNVNECDDPEVECPGHAECHDLPGRYECVCCLGYIMEGDQCIRDVSQDEVYGAPGKECCACTGKPCSDPQPVCGTDGQTYTNYKAMVVTACREHRHVEADYQGPCTASCEDAVCGKPYETCEEVNGAATCTCPSCGAGGPPPQSERVCGSNGRVYPSQCHFQRSVCEADRPDVTMESSLEPCKGDEGEPVGPWSEWSECDNACGRGTTRRFRQKLGDTDFPLEQQAVCYTVCQDGPCREDTCLNPGQVCQVSEATGSAECVCPDCQGLPDSAVCGLVGRVVRTFDNPCLMQQKACELTKNFTLLEERACEDKPRECAVIRNFAQLTDTQGCRSLGSQDTGECYGGCGDVPGQCCLPVKNDSPVTVKLTFRCPDGSTRRRQHEKITACKCVDIPED